MVGVKQQTLIDDNQLHHVVQRHLQAMTALTELLVTLFLHCLVVTECSILPDTALPRLALGLTRYFTTIDQWPEPTIHQV